jgi:hypothetical protein
MITVAQNEPRQENRARRSCRKRHAPWAAAGTPLRRHAISRSGKARCCDEPHRQADQTGGFETLRAFRGFSKW